MKTILKITGLLAILIMLAACNHGNNTPSSTEKFTKTKVFNPNTAKVKLISVANNRAADEEEVCEVEPLKSKDVDLGQHPKLMYLVIHGHHVIMMTNLLTK